MTWSDTVNAKSQLLIDAREAKGMTVLKLALLFQIQPAQIYAVESGKRGAGVTLLNRYVHHGLITSEQAARYLGINGAAA